MKRIKIFTLLFVLLFATNGIKAQDVSIDQIVGQNLEYNVISTAVPFMMIAPDARSSAMGDVGVSTSPMFILCTGTLQNMHSLKMIFQ